MTLSSMQGQLLNLHMPYLDQFAGIAFEEHG